VGVVHEAIADGVGNSRIDKRLMPGFRRHLRGDHSAAAVLAIFDHLEKIASFGVRHGVEQEVVEYEDVDPRALAQ
jgi:hypothetical protein